MCAAELVKKCDPVITANNDPSLRGRRVLLVAPQPFFANRGTPINVRALATTLAADGASIDLLAYPIGEEIELANVRIIRSLAIPGITSIDIGPSWKKILLDIFLSLKGLQLATFNKYDVFHGIEEGAFVAGVLAALKKKPFIFDMDSCMADQIHASGFLSSKLFIGFFRSLERFFLRRASAILTVCEELSNFSRITAPSIPVIQLEDFPLDSSTVIDANLITNLRNQYSLSNRHIFLYTGNLEWYQGIDLMLDAWALALKALPDNATLLIVGGNPDDIRKYTEKVVELGLHDRVIFVGERPGTEMGTFMALADVLVSPRVHGTNTPLKVFTYMATGKPIVATDISSHTQVLSESSAFMGSIDAQSFARAMVASSDPSPDGRIHASSRGTQARKLIDERFNRKHFERGLLKLYRDLLK